jgi:hypothetical protein
MKYTKEEVLAMRLDSFGIRPLKLWVNKPEANRAQAVRHAKWRAKGEELKSCLSSIEEWYLEKKAEQPYTVADLIKEYRYNFFPKSETSLGHESMNDLKNRLIKLGLTPNDWPAIVIERKYLLDQLSVEMLLSVPIPVIFFERNTLRNGRQSDAAEYFKCSLEELKDKTLHDFIKIDPTMRSIFRGKRFLVSLWQRLAKAGVSEDYPFMKWNPGQESLEKARKVLGKYQLTTKQIDQFSKIVVSERWVI